MPYGDIVLAGCKGVGWVWRVGVVETEVGSVCGFFQWQRVQAGW